MKGRRPLFYGAGLVLLVAGLLTGIRIFYVLLFSQVVLLICALLINFFAAMTFTYLQNLSREITLRGSPVQMTLEIHNEKPIPFPMMRIQVMIANEPGMQLLSLNLPPRSHQTYELDMACPYRGEYAVGMTVVDLLDIFGLIRLPFDMRMLPYYRMKTLLVLPRLVLLPRLNMPALDVQQFSRNQTLTENHNEPFAMVRPYRPGDPGKQIHWKASLRQHKLMTRIYEQSSEHAVELLLDLRQPEKPGEEARQTEDIFCECATALIYHLLKLNWQLKITGYGRQKIHRTGSSLKDFQELYHWLARVPFDGSGQFSQQMVHDLASGSSARAVLILTGRPDTDLAKILHQDVMKHLTCYTLVTGPVKINPREVRMGELFHQAGLPVWFIHYGESLADILRVDT